MRRRRPGQFRDLCVITAYTLAIVLQLAATQQALRNRRRARGTTQRPYARSHGDDRKYVLQRGRPCNMAINAGSTFSGMAAINAS